MKDKENFIQWVTKPSRTNDELFTVELLIERVRVWQHWPFRNRGASGFQEQMKVKKDRRFNPAYRPILAMDELKALQERWESVTHFAASGMGDRPLRDLTALRFFPALENINITGIDLVDLSALGGLPKVSWLTLMEDVELGRGSRFDFAQLGPKPALDHLCLSLRQPWPDLTALATWPAVREVIFGGNLLAFSEIETLPAAQVVRAQKWVESSTPLRDLRTFPSMPQVKRLSILPTSSLTGIERYGTVLNLELGGDFADLTPLEALENVTFLQLTGEYFTDLTPLTRLPRLRELALVRERPIDLSPLTDAPQLRRVSFERCATMRTEVAALNAGLLSEEHDFLAETPRPLGPLKFYLIRKDHDAGKQHQVRRHQELSQMRESFHAGDAAMEKAEARSFLGNLFIELNHLLGRGWGVIQLKFLTHAGRTQLSFKRYRDTARIRETIQLLREHSARSRLPWAFDIAVEPHGDMSYELKQLQELETEARAPEGHWLAQYFAPEEALKENQEGERHYREKQELLEREHIYRLRQQQGEIIDPELQPPAPEDDDDELEDLDETLEEPLSATASDEDDETGGVALAPPPPAPPDAEGLSDQLFYAITLFEDAMYVSEGWADRARYGLGEAPEEWTEPS